MRAAAGTETPAPERWVARLLASVLAWLLLAACGGCGATHGGPDASDAGVGGGGDGPGADAPIFDGTLADAADAPGDGADGSADDNDGDDGNGFCGDVQQLSPPEFSPPRGALYVCQGADVMITCHDTPPTGNGRIYYTTDNTLPTRQSPVYMHPISIDNVGIGTIRAICSDPSDCFVDSMVALFTPLGPPIDCGDGGIVVRDAGGD
jgi:hypothetical protein